MKVTVKKTWFNVNSLNKFIRKSIYGLIGQKKNWKIKTGSFSHTDRFANGLASCIPPSSVSLPLCLLCHHMFYKVTQVLCGCFVILSSVFTRTGWATRWGVQSFKEKSESDFTCPVAFFCTIVWLTFMVKLTCHDNHWMEHIVLVRILTCH